MEAAFAQAARDHAQGSLPQAVAGYRAVLAAAPGHAEARARLAHASYNLGNAQARAGELRAAVVAYRQAVAAAPGLAEAHANLVRALLGTGAAADALVAAAAALDRVDTAELRRLFVRGAGAAERVLSAAEQGLLVRAFHEGWARMPEVALAAVRSLLAGELDGGNELLLASLVCAPIADERLERRLRTLRERLLAEGGEPRLIEALARQGFINEYCWPVTEAEQRALLDTGDPVRMAMYAPMAGPGPWPEALVRQQVTEPAEEAALRETMPAMTPVVDAVSVAVRAQYEEHPYPRWVVADRAEPVQLGAFLRRAVPGGGFAAPPDGPFDMLIAGCGTGQHSVTAARRFPQARIVAIDLSRASLAYAARKTREAGLSIAYAQADILALAGRTERFDVIDASGVLHHLADPVAGWRALAGLLKPAGLMRIGLYSRAGRQHVASARAMMASGGFGPGQIQEARSALMALPPEAEARKVVASYDFYSASSCRDLLLHVQEQDFTISEIVAALRELGLRFLGFDVPDDVRARLSGDETNLSNWDALEASDPFIFTGMYQFWVTRG